MSTLTKMKLKIKMTSVAQVLKVAILSIMMAMKTYQTTIDMKLRATIQLIW